MRLAALAFTFAFALAVTGQEPAQPPKKNPFRDGSGKGITEPDTTAKKVEPTKPDPVKNAPKVLRAAEAGVGRLVADVAFTDLAGKTGKLSEFKAKLTVVAFTNTTCPICKKYAPGLARLEKEYAAKGVAFLFVNPTATEKVTEHGFAGRYIPDTDGKLTAALGATSTAEVFVLDAARTVVYRGAVDDQYGLGYALDAPRAKYLAVALDEALAGKVPVVAATTAPGCALEPDAAKAPAVALTYHARIERIVQANCVECHRKGGVAPFALEKYEDVVAHKAMMKKVVDDATMPPWFAAHAKADRSPFANDRSLTAADKKDLLAWLSGDLKKGDAADAPLPRKYESGWLIGKPDAEFQIPKAIAVKAEGTMGYQTVRVDTGFDEDRWVQAVEVQPTAREVVHHVLVFAVPKGARPGGEAAGFFAVYVPGNNMLVYPDGYAKKLPKGATLYFQIHYTPNGKATTDQTKIGMVFARQAPRHEILVAGVVNTRFQIPAGADNHEVTAKIPVPFDAKVLALFPHAHLRGKAAKFDLKTPDGKSATLLDVPHYDFNWQLQYRFADPVAAPRGSSLTYTAWYDNSEKNPANPDPKKAVRWGQQTYEEMHLGYVEYVLDRK
jgi:thiol-disulfide isomerase/thioredoxin/mono/diheme cytochrome c family protein